MQVIRKPSLTVIQPQGINVHEIIFHVNQDCKNPMIIFQFVKPKGVLIRTPRMVCRRQN